MALHPKLRAMSSNAALYELADVLTEAIADASASGNTSGAKILQESFDRLRMLAREDQEWTSLFGDNGDSEFMLRLEDLKAWAKKITESVPGAPWIGKGFRARADFVWKDGIQYGNVPSATQGRKNIQKIIDRPGNRREFFGKAARRKREHNLYTQGIAIWKGDDSSHNLETIPLRQITGELLDPQGRGVIWALLREWSERDLATGRSRPMKKWYFAHEFIDKRVLNITGPDGVRVPVDQKARLFIQHANAVEGYAYGTPDAVAAWIWNAIARDSYMDGRKVTEALTRFAVKATAGSRQAADNVAMQYATADTAGGMAIVGGATDISIMQGAQKGYDFASLRPMLAVVATSLDIPTTLLTSDTGDDSFASIASLDLPTRLAMQARREEHVELDTQVLEWLGIENPDVQFIPYDAGDEIYRKIQSLALELTNDVITRQEFRDQVDTLLGRASGTVPADAERESYLKAKQLAKAAPKPAPAAAGAPSGQDDEKTGTSTASPNQGRSNGTGGQSGAANDLRKDTISK